MIAKERYIKRYCKDFENIENYDLAMNDSTQMWECHHRLETNFSDGNLRPKNAQLSHNELIDLGMYWNRPANELIFLTRKDHRMLHRINESIIDYGCRKNDKEAYNKAYHQVWYNDNKEKVKDRSKARETTPKRKAYNKARKATPEYKCREKVRMWLKRNDYPNPSLVKFPNSWGDDEKNEYLRQFNKRMEVIKNE